MSMESGSNAMRKRHDPIPVFDIAVILESLGAECVPTGDGWRRFNCPFHSDRTASAGVNHETGRFRCHSCDVGGDGLSLLQSQLGLSFRDALQRARELTGMSTDERKSPKRRASDLLR